MDQQTFDTLSRSVGEHAGTRRALLRLVAGSALAGVAARFSRLESEAAKTHKHETSGRAKQAHRAAGRSARHSPAGVHTEGKGKGNGKHRRRHAPPKDPQQPKPQLCPVDCTDEGGKCCSDGSCVSRLLCCPGEKSCGERCVAATTCCPGESPCADGLCPAPGKCCKEEFRCDDGTCIAPLDECCPGQRMCAGNRCVPKNTCCPGHKKCQDDSCVTADQCCSEAPTPSCRPCEMAVCERGEMVCRASDGLDACQTVCPEGSVSCPLMSGMVTGLPDGCCQAGRVFPDEWYGTGNMYCRPPGDWQGYWCTMDGLPGV
jgi:hypothetical protein